MAYDVLVIGDSSIDQYLELESVEIHEDLKMKQPEICFVHGSKVPVKTFASTLAGNACHVAVGLQRLNINTAIYTELGEDQNGSRFIEKYKSYGINTHLCRQNKGVDTNVHTIIWGKGDRTIFSYHYPYKYEVEFTKLPQISWVFYTSLADGFETFQADLVKYLNANPSIGLAFNPGTYHMRAGTGKLLNVLKRTDILFVNREEAYAIIGLPTGLSAAQTELHEKLQKLGPKKTVITNGKHGSSASDGESYEEMPIIKVAEPIVDKTGAGDAFAAAFMAAIYYKKSLKEALLWGTKNSASIVKCVGCIDGLLTKKEITS
ncbi:carbohydrate kinase family protein [Candidatus Nomurabacteria bacterium]|uniref:Carbohydrate kinase family protein n=1 Tax=candidate division WWE3 bacterium TaxID=2053526 RepID=A0A955DZK5_UNCKA|nr:carbohydrate kinase family protein [candidate division WWE3 bacterium]MCB9823561.1 carbohydrate kinase family protein [Candidatus Nomurabacteria bacterium]MCB9827356.1 carbohydrate kinase family protein [Candidatus Nomurabacteria bacterium]